MAGQAKILVVNADDFGLSQGINRGILSAHQNGILRSTSIMPNGSAFEDAVRIARETPELGVGIHLSLIGEKSVSPAGELRGMVNDEGLLPDSYPAFTRQLLSKRFNAGHVRTEIRAQIELVLTAGIDPTHIDSHQHLHMLPAVFDIVLDVAREYAIPVVRIPLHRGGGTGRGGTIARLVQALILPRIDRSRLRQVEAAGLRTADWFWGLEVSGKMDEASLMATLQSLGLGVNEVMCHPGISDAATAERYQWGYSWDDGLAALQSDAVRRFVDDNDIRLASFKDAWDESLSP